MQENMNLQPVFTASSQRLVARIDKRSKMNSMLHLGCGSQKIFSLFGLNGSTGPRPRESFLEPSIKPAATGTRTRPPDIRYVPNRCTASLLPRSRAAATKCQNNPVLASASAALAKIEYVPFPPLPSRHFSTSRQTTSITSQMHRVVV